MTADNKDLLRYVLDTYGFELKRCIAVVSSYNITSNDEYTDRIFKLLDEAQVDNSSPTLMMKLQILVSDSLFKLEDNALANRFEQLITNEYADAFTDFGKQNALGTILDEYRKVIER
jgi:hypothetical protein